MQLSLVRSQKSGFSSVIFCLDARVGFAADERANITRYKLGGQVIYNSEASKRSLERAEMQNDGSMVGGLKGLASLALAAMKLNITVNSLSSGQHIECKSLDELLGAEEAVITACKNLRGYLDAAATFDGRQVVVNFDGTEPAVVASATPQPALVVPAAAPGPTAVPPIGEPAFASADGAPIAAPIAQAAALNRAPDFDIGDWFKGRSPSWYIKWGAGLLLAFFFLHSCLHAF